jgi:hypothetical protein
LTVDLSQFIFYMPIITLQEFVELALDKGEIKDRIIDEHHLLLYIKFCSERPGRTRKGDNIPGTFIGMVCFKSKNFLILFNLVSHT